MQTHRAGRTVDDLRRAGQLMARGRQTRRSSRERPPPSSGGTPPRRRSPSAPNLRLWSDDGEDVAWTWHDGDEIEWHVWTGDPGRDVEVFRSILESAVHEASVGPIGIFTVSIARRSRPPG